MFKIRLIIAIVLCMFLTALAQPAKAQSTYSLQIKFVEATQAAALKDFNFESLFPNKLACEKYISSLPQQLQFQGYLAASLDSAVYSESAALITIFLGPQYTWANIKLKNFPSKFGSLVGWQLNNLQSKRVSFAALQNIQFSSLAEFQNTGYPFATVNLDSVVVANNQVSGILIADKGIFYRVDSLNIVGSGRISKQFLANYLGIENGSPFNKQKLEKIDPLLQQLPFIQIERKSDLSMLARSAIVNLYLAPKKNSTVSAIVGFLPNPTEPGKLQITGDINLNLKNTFGKGETIIALWQQLQQKSPRLNLGYQQPYLFASKFGVDASFELFKKDSSFLQTQLQFGAQYILNASQQFKLFLQNTSRFLLADGVDTVQIKLTKKLPINIDVNATSIGLEYSFINTDYRVNPLKGFDIRMNSTFGIKNIKPNSTIVNIVDPNFSYKKLYDSFALKTYQIRLLTSLEKYNQLGKQSTLKTALHAGFFISPTVFRNELFQIGGYKLLRGFNEESIYATNYLVANAEYRYRLALNSYFFGFVNAGWVQNKFQAINVKESYQGAGLGIVFENKFGLLNFSYAIGKASNTTFKFSDASKIHFGYVNYF